MNNEVVSLQEIESLLKENFKLSSYEARAYLSLLKNGAQNTKQVSASSGVPMPRIYDTLESLMAKGFVIKQDGNYAPIPTKQALHGRSSQFELQFSQEQKHRKEAEEQLISVLDELVSGSGKSQNTGEISILKGFNTIANKFGELLEDSTDIMLVAKRAVEARDIFIPIISEYTNQKRKRVRIIAPKNVRIKKKEADDARIGNVEIPKSEHVNFDMMITDKDDVIIGVPDPLSGEINHAIAIWVRNNSFARSTRNAIEEIWKYSERV